MISKGVLIHYNGEWVQKEGSDDYNGLLALVGVPDNYNVGDVKKRAMDISGFLHGPCFDVYGLINVSGSAFKQRFKSGSEAMFNFYVGQASGVPRFFTIKYRKEVKVDISPLTPKPTNGDDRGSKDLPYTLLTPVHNLKSSSCDDYESENEMAKRDGGGKGSNSGLKSMRCFPESTSGPKARRCLKPVMTPSFKKICCLHDTSSTPASILDGPEPTKDMKYNDLRVGNTFKSKGEMRLILVTSKIERNFEYIATKYDRLRFIAKCRDKTCKWRMCTVPLNSCGWWRFAVANDVHTCGSNKRTDQDLRTNRVAGGIAELFKHKLKDLDAAFMPKQLVKDIKRKYGVVINYRYGYSACKRGIEHIKGIPEESYQHLVGYSYMLGNHNVGTVSEIVIENEDCFLYYFFALGVCIQGFKNCFRPAFAVDENNESREWFMRKLVGVLGDEYAMNEDVVVATDMHPSIARALKLAFPCVNQVFWIHHLSENIKQNFHNVAASMAFVRAGKAFNDDDYEISIRDLGVASQGALNFIRKLGPEMWARVKDKTSIIPFILLIFSYQLSWIVR